MVDNFLTLWHDLKKQVQAETCKSNLKKIYPPEGRFKDLTSPKQAVKISKHKSKVSDHPKNC